MSAWHELRAPLCTSHRSWRRLRFNDCASKNTIAPVDCCVLRLRFLLPSIEGRVFGLPFVTAGGCLVAPLLVLDTIIVVCLRSKRKHLAGCGSLLHSFRAFKAKLRTIERNHSPIRSVCFFFERRQARCQSLVLIILPELFFCHYRFQSVVPVSVRRLVSEPHGCSDFRVHSRIERDKIQYNMC